MGKVQRSAAATVKAERLHARRLGGSEALELVHAHREVRRRGGGEQGSGALSCPWVQHPPKAARGRNGCVAGGAGRQAGLLGQHQAGARRGEGRSGRTPRSDVGDHQPQAAARPRPRVGGLPHAAAAQRPT